MRLIKISLFVFLATGIAGSAWAQGLYGAPDSLRMQQPAAQQQQPVANPYANTTPTYPAQPGYTGGYTQPVTPYAQPVAPYAQPVAPYSAPSQYVAPQTQYPAPAGYAPQQPVQPTAVPPAAVQPAASQPVYRTASAARPSYVSQQPTQPFLNAPAEPAIEPVPQGPSVTNQMLNERGQTGAAGSDGYVPYNSACGPCASAVNQYKEAACGLEGVGGCNASCMWYASLSGLALSRNDANQVWVANLASPNEDDQMLKTNDAETGWKFGGEIRFGHRFCCYDCSGCNASAGYWAIEADYWTCDPFQGYASFKNADNSAFETPLNVRYTSYNLAGGAYTNASDWFNNAYEMRVWRRDEVQSAEINFVRGQWANVGGSNWDFAFTAGPRFFRFYEDLQLGVLGRGAPGSPVPVWGQNSGYDEVYIRDQITNNLWGAQLGVDLGYNFASGALRIFVTPKVGIYDNNITSTYQSYTGNGGLGWDNYNHNPNDVPIYSSTTRNVFSVLAQVDVGAEWFFLERWSARVGYRVVSASGIGLADNQFVPYINDLPAVGAINSNGELLLHGAFATVTFNF